MASMHSFTAVLKDSRDVSPTNKLLAFERPATFTFLPGQYVFIEIPKPEGKIVRAYSIASTPEGPFLEFCVTLVPGGPGSTALHEAKPGDSFLMKGPVGKFVLKKSKNHLIFFATGSGVSPFRSMIAHALGEGWENEMTLVFGVRYEEDIVFRKEWEALEKKHKNFRFIPTVSRGADSWKGERGYVQTKLDLLGADKTASDAYICGLSKMVMEAKDALIKADFPEECIHFERYD